MVALDHLRLGGLFVVLARVQDGLDLQFLSKAVIVGFLFGAGIQTTIGELAKITGTEASGDNSWQKARELDRQSRRHPRRDRSS